VNVREFISSGILESYLLGTASSDEIRQVQEMEKLHPEIREELDLIESSLVEHASTYAGASSAHMENRIRKNIFPSASSETRVLPISSAPKNNYRIFAIAAGLLLAISLFLGYSWYSSLLHSNEMAKQHESELEELNIRFKQYEAELASLDHSLKIIEDPSNKRITLAGTPLSPSSAAIVYWNQNDRSVHIDVRSLPEAPAGKQYQLWAIVDGKPVDAGVFEIDQTLQLQQMKVMPAAQAFAVTLENSGGNAQPTLEAMYLLGNV
jgi:anti-sigma-K factor RskA